MTTSVSDSELVLRCQRGDAAAFDVLVRRHEQRVVNVAYRMLGERDAAHDVAQEAFLSAWKSLPRFRSDASFATWLYRIAYNVCLDHSRRTRRLPEPLPARAPDEASSFDPPDPSPGPDSLAETSELQERVHEALARLPLKHRSLLVLFDIQGLSYEQIAEILRLPMGTVKSRLNRARHALREELAPLLEQGSLERPPTCS